MKGIKKRLFLNYFIGTFVVLFALEAIFMFSIKNYYYNSVERGLKEKVSSISTLFNQYVNKNSSDLSICFQKLLQNNNDEKYSEIQIIDKKGNVLLDSGVVPNKKVKTSDFTYALEGKQSSWKGRNAYTGEGIMSASSPLMDIDSNQVAVIRYVTSLGKVNKILLTYFFISSSLCVFILVMVWALSIILSKSIIEPIKEINFAARKMAKGEFSERIHKQYNDEIGELSDTINYMASEIEKAQELKNDFISSVSHEIRTPLTSIKGWSETVLSGDLENKEEAIKGLNVILKETDRLKNMVEELLDFSKLEGGKLSLFLEETELKKELEEIINFSINRAKKEGKSIELCCEGYIPKISVDKSRIRQVIINILDNAIKFSYPNTIVTVKLMHMENKIIIGIKDEGCGISEVEVLKVKEKFYKGSSKKSGSGIGLAVSDEIVKLHGGNIEIKSQLGQGTEVSITLPVRNTL